MHTLADKRTQWPTLFREWFCNSEANRHEICTRLRQRVRNKVSRISSESVKSHSMKLTMMFKLDLKKMTLTAFRTPVQNGLMREVNIFCTENEHLHAFYAPNKKSCKLDKGIMLIFVSEINRPLLLAKGVVIIFGWWLRPPTIYDETGAAACNIHCYTVIGFW